MEQLIKITEENGKRAVNARELHQFLESKQKFADWIKNRIDKYGFTEGSDYQAFHKFMKCQNGVGGTNRTEYALSIDMAKELSMVENNERGRQARKYFIECERMLIAEKEKQTPQTYLEALKALIVAEEEKERLRLENLALEEDNKYKDDVIEGLVEEIPVADMRQRINQIVTKAGGGDFGGAWRMLFAEFDRKFHINVGMRMVNSGFSGNCIDYIEKELNMIPELYELACKLFESTYDKLIESWGKYAKRAKVVKKSKKM